MEPLFSIQLFHVNQFHECTVKGVCFLWPSIWSLSSFFYLWLQYKNEDRFLSLDTFEYSTFVLSNQVVSIIKPTFSWYIKNHHHQNHQKHYSPDFSPCLNCDLSIFCLYVTCEMSNGSAMHSINPCKCANSDYNYSFWHGYKISVKTVYHNCSCTNYQLINQNPHHKWCMFWSCDYWFHSLFLLRC